jgi:hypothetical protein
MDTHRLTSVCEIGFSFVNVLRIEGPPLWSSGQSSSLQIRRPVSIPGTTRKKR